MSGGAVCSGAVCSGAVSGGAVCSLGLRHTIERPLNHGDFANASNLICAACRYGAAMQDAYGHCEALVRAADKDRYLAGLFAPAP